MRDTVRPAQGSSHRSGPEPFSLVGRVALVLALAAAPPAAWQGAPPPGNRADYTIEARLDGEGAEPRAMRGSLEVAWTNGSGEPVSDLWFHLYLNAFSNNRSTHLVESDGKLRDEKVADGWGWSRVTALRVTGADGVPHDVLPSFRYRRPDDENKEDRTVFSVDLPFAVQEGEVLRAQVEWEAQLPRVRRRTGYKDDFLLVAQWFPKLGVYERGRGWNCHQFHASTEFFSDYGTYDVTLNLPARYKDKIYGTGILERGVFEAGRHVVRFLAPSERDRRTPDWSGRLPLVHDFTWTADPDYVVDEGIYRFDDWAERYAEEVRTVQELLGPDVPLRTRDVDVTVLVQPEHAAQAERHRRATEAALFFYGLWFGEYPYQHITVVDPAWGARAAGGMEYPTLFTCGTRLFATEDMHTPESVTVHECGHQFWYGLVGNNEFEASWLDEGFNSYTDSEVLWRVYGNRRDTTDFARRPIDGVPLAGLPRKGSVESSPFASVLPLPWLAQDASSGARGLLELYREQPSLSYARQQTDPRWSDRSRYLGNPDTDPVQTPAWLYADRSSYGVNSYQRPAVALRTLAGLVGRGPFLAGMRHYAKTWRYRHPYPEDFYRTFQEGAGVEIPWYFDEVFRGTGTVDWSVGVRQARRSAPRGAFQSEGGAFLELGLEAGPEGKEPWEAEVMLRKRGTLALPIPVRLRFDDGSEETVVWTREEQLASSWKRIERTQEAKLVSAALDPDRRYYLDADMSDNQWFDATDELVPWRWGERCVALQQRYFHWIAGLGG